MASFLARTAGLGTNAPVVNAKTVGGKAANGIVRAASASTGTAVALTTADDGVTVASVNIDAPSAGYLLTTFSGTFTVGTATPLIHYGVDVDLPTSSAWANSFANSAAISAPTLGFHAGALSQQTAVAAGAHTVRIKAHNDGNGTVSYAGGSVTVVFVPFNGAGAGALEVPAPAPQGGNDVARP